MSGLSELPAGLSADLDAIRAETERLRAGTSSVDASRSFLASQGIYEERQGGTFMLRVRLPAGVAPPAQMRALAEVSRTRANGVLHVTTRQDVQIHGVALDSIPPALEALRAAGLATKGGGGDTVRNVTACVDAGVCADEAFDVTPYAVALTEFLMSDPGSFRLPRKYKIALSGCGRDCARATVSDLGLIAGERDGEHGFAVYVGGGMGAHSRVADKLEDFAPADDVFLMAEAVKRVFDRHGNRENRKRARLRFLIKRIGFGAFRKLYEAELAELRQASIATPRMRAVPIRRAGQPAASQTPVAGFDGWRRRNVTSQKDGTSRVEIALFLGDIEAGMLESLAGLVERYGEGSARATPSQNLAIRSVQAPDVAALHRGLVEAGLAASPARVVREMVSCVGAETCRLGMCRSRDLARAIREALEADGIDLDRLGALDIGISGCPNTCAGQAVAAIGLQGVLRRVDGRPVPHYAIELGGRTGEGKTRLGSRIGVLPARNVPAFLAAFLRAFAESPECPDFDAFLDAGGFERARALATERAGVGEGEEETASSVSGSAKGL